MKHFFFSFCFQVFKILCWSKQNVWHHSTRFCKQFLSKWYYIGLSYTLIGHITGVHVKEYLWTRFWVWKAGKLMKGYQIKDIFLIWLKIEKYIAFIFYTLYCLHCHKFLLLMHFNFWFQVFKIMCWSKHNVWRCSAKFTNQIFEQIISYWPNLNIDGLLLVYMQKIADEQCHRIKRLASKNVLLKIEKFYSPHILYHLLSALL